MNRLALVFALLPFSALADQDLGPDPGPEVARVLDACLKADGPIAACIGQGAEACRGLDLGAANPIQQDGWCDQYEAEFWKARRVDATNRLLGLLRGQSKADFLAEQTKWDNAAHGNFPCDRVDRFWPVGFTCMSRTVQIEAIRTLLVEDSLSLAEECEDADSEFRIEALCADVVGAK